MVTEIAVGHHHLELGIEDQKRLQQVLLGPKPELVHHPITPVIEGKKMSWTYTITTGVRRATLL